MVMATFPAVPVPEVWVSISAIKESEVLVIASRLPDWILIAPALPLPVVLAVRVGDRSFAREFYLHHARMHSKEGIL